MRRMNDSQRRAMFRRFAAEEHKTAVEYRRLGFKGMAADEARHSRTFTVLSRQKPQEVNDEYEPSSEELSADGERGY